MKHLITARHLLRRIVLSPRLHRARRGFRQNYIEWKKTDSTAAKLNVTILAARIREMEQGA